MEAKKNSRPATMTHETSKATKTTRTETTRAQTAFPLTPLNAKTIAERAYRLWESRGRQHGHDLEHWLEAERQLRSELDGRR